MLTKISRRVFKCVNLWFSLLKRKNKIMCCLKFSKNIVPFVITFVLGIFIVGIFSYFTSSNKVKTYQINEVKVYSSEKKSKCMYDEKTNVYSLQKREEERIVKPTFAETIIINEEVKQSRK